MVLGAGPVGAFAIKLLSAGGIRDLTVVEINKNRLEWARRFGAAILVEKSGDEALKEIRELYLRVLMWLLMLLVPKLRDD